MFKIFNLKFLIFKLLRPRVKYEPLIEVRVFRDAILHNLSVFQKAYPNLQFAPVLKSNAYGHGLVEVAGILDEANHSPHPGPLPQGGREKNRLPFFMVDSFYEALVLRRANIKTKILILGYATAEQIQSGLKKVSFGIISLEQLKLISEKVNSVINIHLKIDTGMHRQGILIEEIGEAVKIIQGNKKINLEGVCSHFADADGENQEFTKEQIEKWNQAVEIFKKNFQDIKYFHISNTAGAFYADKIFTNVSRLGLGLYGFNQSPFVKMNLKPALEVNSIITTIKTIPSGEKVGYNCTYISPSQVTIATVPVGYYEGLDRRLSNKGFVKVKNIFCPIAGRISMNMCSINISGVENVKIGDAVNIVSANTSDKNSIENMVKLSGSTEHEFRIHIPQHLKREVV